MMMRILRLSPRSAFRQPREPEPSTINEKTIADFTRVGEQMGILERDDVKEAAN
jgi:hypothetical protein